ncbi:DoxX family protein [Plastoroseomonas hellenica]|uniref:DoxX family protein n=1 Tax=Plastoroseomonas hellenica TaxID=2687306 RepID=A0ABS5EYD3_9PROT|nr:DoxX family protein [Plastoroseomonas hellenica]MBR0644786.1 DoxX family protein [Plastoroseomonas hellenica]MBR0665302.1 DoxX family protein [Plastoroseomonas hellenica]
MTSPIPANLAPYALAALRIMAALMFLAHGTQKFFSFPNAFPMGGPPATFTLLWFAGAIELVGGVLIAIGLFTRPAAFLASGMAAFAYFYAHAPRAFYPIMNGGELAALYAFVFLYIAAAGPGRFSLDGQRG